MEFIVGGIIYAIETTAYQALAGRCSAKLLARFDAPHVARGREPGPEKAQEDADTNNGGSFLKVQGC